MDSRIQDQIRNYTKAIDAMAPSVDALAPSGAPGSDTRRSQAVVGMVAREPTRRSSPVAGWLAGVAAVAFALIVTVPVWLWLSASDDDPIATIAPAVSTTPPTTLPATTTIPLVETTRPTTVPTTEPVEPGAAVRQAITRCGVGWADDLGIVWDPECDATNVRHDDGGWTLVLYGRIPDAQFEAFQAAGVSEFATTCWVNYLFVVQDGDEPIVVESVRQFTPDGEMTEICRLAPSS